MESPVLLCFLNYSQNLMRCAISYHLYNLKNVKNTHGGVFLLVKACNFTKSSIPPWVFFTLFKLYKWYQIAQNITYGISDSAFLSAYMHRISRHSIIYANLVNIYIQYVLNSSKYNQKLPHF